MPATPLSALRAVFPPDDLLHGLLDASLVGTGLYQPVFAADGSVVDFTILLFNAEAQRILGQPERPTQTYLQLFPHTQETGVFDFHRRAFESGIPARLDVNYQGDGLDNFFRLSARRVGQGLVVSFTDTSDQTRTAVEDALRDSQRREQAARADAERQRNLLEAVIHQAPVAIGFITGSEQIITSVNPLMATIWGRTPEQVLGLPLLEALPELRGQGFDALVDQVLRTGVPHVGSEMPARLLRHGQLETNYYNFVYQPFYDEAGAVIGVIDVAVEVTDQVRARQLVEESRQELQVLNIQLEAANEDLAAINEEMEAANEEIRANHNELLTAQQALQVLNHDLEARVAAGTRQAQQAQKEAEHQRARLERFFMQAPAAICILDGPELVFELVNPGYQQLFPERQLLGKRILDALPEIAGHAVHETFRHVFETGKTHEEQSLLIPLARPDDGVLEDRYFTFIQQARFDDEGCIDGVLVFAFEVTEQVQARHRAEQAGQEFRTLTDAIPHLVWTATPGGEVDYCNDQWFAYTGSTPSESYGQGWASFYHSYDLPGLQQHWMQAVASGTPYQIQARLRRHDGIYHWFMVRVVALRNARGAVTKWFGTCTDIHEQKGLAEALQLASRKLATTNRDLRAANEKAQHANQELGITNEQLTRINQDLDNFVYTASHDLKQPLHNMAGVFEELKRTATFNDPEAEKLVNMFEVALQQIHSTIHGLSQVVQVERLTEHLPAEPVAVHDLAQNVIQSMQAQASAQKAHFELDFSAVPTLRFARTSLQSILYNLLSNALKYAAPGREPRVRVTTELEPDGAPTLVVQDNGLGLDLERYGTDLFQMFRRFHTHVAGSGMGLYLINRIVQQAGGRIDVESSLGQGTTFRVRLPANALPAA
ncbi:PAS domain-containing protein [Hymenobacter busanensis]|uniref:histidine kinase n=1 Tax=Hymenobacter busanensis TaxID=2607656 RepID=A0A7L4ZSE9_9BACT|nr:PAS domain-containing protein [Hymenobacter busanensis]KAA9327662.1 PAS domain-containing protein [Hymenobacter busanensis]QHJ05998.1 PAS domain-containing protein [Hymenobacter busanensis]